MRAPECSCQFLRRPIILLPLSPHPAYYQARGRWLQRGSWWSTPYIHSLFWGLPKPTHRVGLPERPREVSLSHPPWGWSRMRSQLWLPSPSGLSRWQVRPPAYSVHAFPAATPEVTCQATAPRPQAPICLRQHLSEHCISINHRGNWCQRHGKGM